LAAGLLLLMASAQAQPPTTKYALTGGMLLDGYEVPATHHATILVDGNKIVAVGPASEIKIPPGYTIVDTSGRTMMPGLIEPHAHLVIVGHGNYFTWFKWLEAHKDKYPIEDVMALSAKQLLLAGITGAIDLGSPLKESVDLREKIKRNELPGPRMLMSGPWIIRQNAIFPDYCQIVIKTPEEAAKATEQLIAGGADVIKAQGGLNYEDLKAISDTAHQHRVRVHAHLYEETAVLDAFRAGVDILQHVGSAGVPPYSESTLKLLADSGRPVVPTAAHRPFIFPATLDFPERLQDPEIKATFPPDMWAEVQDSFKNFHTLGYFQATDRETIYADRDVEQFIKAGVVMGMGTDNGTPMNFHADALWREAKVFVDHGLPPIKAISSLTRINARIMGMQNQIGTIEPGKLADIIVVQGNPLFDITASLSNVEVVMKDGIIYKGGPAGGAGSRASAAR